MIIETKYSGACVMKGLSITHRYAQIDFSHLFYVYVCMYWFRQDLFFSSCVFLLFLFKFNSYTSIFKFLSTFCFYFYRKFCMTNENDLLKYFII